MKQQQNSGRPEVPQNPVVRRAITINIKPERRVLLESSPARGAEPMEPSSQASNEMPPPDSHTESSNIRTHPEVEEKKKSVRDRLGDKVEPKAEGSDASAQAVKDKSSSKHRDKTTSKKEKRTTPTKEKVC